MNKDCVICYVADNDFLFPTLVSAGSVRKFVPPEKADIYIFVIDGDETKLGPLADHVKPEGIYVVPMHSASFSGFDEKEWNVTHVSKASLGRFFITDILPPQYTRIFYLDGDTLVVKDPSALIDYPIPEGKLASVDDKQWFCRNDFRAAKSIRNYFKQIGIREDRGYMNGGVFLSGRDTWAQLSREAYQFFKNNVELCKFHDQSALNAVIGVRRLRLSLAWNFQTHYRDWGLEKSITPIIYHFVGPLKPWLGVMPPWAEFNALYKKEAVRFAPFGVTIKTFSAEKVQESNRRVARDELKLKYVYPLRRILRRLAIRKYQTKTLLNQKN